MAKVNIDIDELRTKTAAEIVEIARDTFGVELQGNKVQLISKINKLINSQEDQQAKEEILTKDVVLQNIKEGLVSRTVPATKLVVNKATGMVFLFNKGLETNSNLIPYKGTPVTVVTDKGINAVMAPEYASVLYPGAEIKPAPDRYLPDEVLAARKAEETAEASE